jgi:hypothetical protein
MYTCYSSQQRVVHYAACPKKDRCKNVLLPKGVFSQSQALTEIGALCMLGRGGGGGVLT